MRRATIALFAATLLACADSTQKPAETPAQNPDIDPVTGRPATTFRFPPVEKIASPLDPASQQHILVDEKGACYVQPNSGTKKPLECPAALKDPAWAKSCHDELVVVRGEVCQCEIFADPPYVGQVPCPKP